MLLRIYSMLGILICQRQGDLKRQNLCTLMMTLQASDGQAFKKKARITSHHAHKCPLLLHKSLALFPLCYYPAVSSSQANHSNQLSLLDLISEIDPYESSSSFVCIPPYHSIIGPFQLIYSTSCDRPVHYFWFYTMQQFIYVSL